MHRSSNASSSLRIHSIFQAHQYKEQGKELDDRTNLRPSQSFYRSQVWANMTHSGNSSDLCSSSDQTLENRTFSYVVQLPARAKLTLFPGQNLQRSIQTTSMMRSRISHCSKSKQTRSKASSSSSSLLHQASQNSASYQQNFVSKHGGEASLLHALSILVKLSFECEKGRSK
jgi:hypothetical protein